LHNGYKKYNAIHLREIIFDKINDEFQIIDEVIVKKGQKTKVEFTYHLNPEMITSNETSNHFSFKNESGRTASLIVDEKLNPLIIEGQVSPFILGWVSNSFLKKKPAPVIYSKININTSTAFIAKIKIT
jgi:hypothetical protein